ncbi:Na+-dependent transporter [Brachybacterium hainanense]|uniref:Na+-dependent transporter n=1 Tax=Brachybacterium hainanense TaxID=1541174 RepID=A0ABV6RF06_9MICO
MHAIVEVLGLLIGISVPVFAIASMLSMGLRTPVETFAAQLRDRRSVLAVAAVNFLLVPAVGIVLLDLLSDLATVGVLEGMVLVLCAAGAPFVLQLGTMARVPYEEVAGPMAVLLVGTVLVMPLTVPFLLDGVEVRVFDVAALLVGTMLAPMVAGIGIGHLLPRQADALARTAGGVAAVSAVLMFLSGFGANSGLVVDLVLSPTMLLAAGLVALAFAGGRLAGALSGPTLTVADGPAILTSQRNIAAALLVARSAPDHDEMVVAVLLVSAVGFCMLVPYALVTGAVRRHRAGERASLGALIGIAEARRR